ncbi:hypothetical protein FH972_023350 [Carpinus fangiana]|uniref:Magnesium transporter n=1 Tax=Carpinus fangiana TaxID=176857 RepID=A0A5N6KUY7_9ROSI|nr:hypothetical protein FH972_023350 [Carpinus fangiana]
MSQRPSQAAPATGKPGGKAPSAPSRPSPGSRAGSGTHVGTSGDTESKTKKRKHRGGRKRKNRRQSFAAPSDTDLAPALPEHPSLLDVPEGTVPEASFYKHRAGSNTSLESEALLDHRDHSETRLRRQSVASPFNGRLLPFGQFRRDSPGLHSTMNESVDTVKPAFGAHAESDEEDGIGATDRTPLISRRQSSGPKKGAASNYGGLNHGTDSPRRPLLSARPSSIGSSRSGHRRKGLPRINSSMSISSFDVNNPPSVPGSPRLGGDEGYDDVMLPEYTHGPSLEYGRGLMGSYGNETVIDIDGGPLDDRPPTGNNSFNQRRRPTGQSGDKDDVCLPFDQMTELGEEDVLHTEEGAGAKMRRSRRRPWPDLAALEDWSRQEREERTVEGLRAKKVSEPEMVGGRLRPRKVAWQREQDDEPFRWTYFNEELDSSLRSHTISGLQQLGLSFRELFIPEAPEIDADSSDDEEEVLSTLGAPPIGKDRSATPIQNGESRSGTRQSSILGHTDRVLSAEQSPGRITPVTDHLQERSKRYGPRPVFWLDVLQPTNEEMRVICRAFGIHKLTAEDIMEQEAREKVELFRNYYFVNYRTFEQDEKNEDYMEPVNMYFVVFKGGVISFHFSQMPHPPNVRRRIRQLAEHQYTDSDWISYAIIDNITDAYAPLIEQIESEVDDIDDEILRLHSKGLKEDEAKRKGLEPPEPKDKVTIYEKIAGKSHGSDSESVASVTSAETSRDMLLRVGECRKRVMGLYRLLGNKADVIKGLAKRCNEQWQVAPRSDVGLYLGDIQDHIVTMTGNLTHYENILSRAHSNYLAQINIRMNERAEQTNDVLGKLTVLGTIVLPMNIITGMWGMNVLVPGQDVDSLTWFWCITAGLVVFGLSCFFIAKKLYRVV